VVFASVFDAVMFREGPPALFTLDPRGELRVDPERTREILLQEPSAAGLTSWEDAPRSPGTWVLRDRATGLRMVVVVTHAWLATLQPRAEATPAGDFAQALAEVRAQWAGSGG
jgi:hypothetical protein